MVVCCRAIATLALDVTKTIGFFSITGLELNLTAIAALLTLIGYSVNDKVVFHVAGVHAKFMVQGVSSRAKKKGGGSADE